MPQLLYFGICRDIIGNREIDELHLHELHTVAELRAYLYENFPALKQLNSLAIAVNEVYATDETPLHDQDVVALIPPVSGG
ncbi:MAG: molybdopterin converting factor subunit 1 [Flavobacteriales bacterium]|nr:molybdopterin converting factor subunit 1 [Flavobacteriales bacterium]